jgi:hypothetical protein
MAAREFPAPEHRLIKKKMTEEIRQSGYKKSVFSW